MNTFWAQLNWTCLVFTICLLSYMIILSVNFFTNSFSKILLYITNLFTTVFPFLRIFRSICPQLFHRKELELKCFKSLKVKLNSFGIDLRPWSTSLDTFFSDIWVVVTTFRQQIKKDDKFDKEIWTIFFHSTNK